MTEDAAATAFGKLAGIATRRSDLFRWLAVAFRNPTEEFVTDLRDGAFVEDIRGALQWLGPDASVYDDALASLRAAAHSAHAKEPTQALQDLKVEYTRLFFGLPSAVVHPFASMHPETVNPEADLLLSTGPVVATVEKAYREAGVEANADLREPPDHIATEFEFLHYLSAKESAAWESGDSDGAKRWRRAQLDFVGEHMAGWALRFFEIVEEKSTRIFYQAAAKLGAVSVRIENGAFKPA